MLFGQNKPSHETLITLPARSGRPQISELMFILKQARGNPNATIEMPWSDSLANKEYVIHCLLTKGQANPNWTVWMVVNQNRTPLLKNETSDVNIINDCLYKIESIQHEAIANRPTPFPSSSQPVASDASLTANKDLSNFQPHKANNESFQQSQNFSQAQSPNPAPAQAQAAYSQNNQKLGSINDNLSLEDKLLSSSSVLEGNLKQMPMQALMQSVANAKLSGKLEILSNENKAEIYFDNGLPYHAYLMGEIGSSAIKEVFTWGNGDYIFLTDDKSNHKTVDKDLISLIAEGLAIAEQKQSLEKAGLAYDTMIALVKSKITESELKTILVKGVPIDFNVQKQIFGHLSVHSSITLQDLLRDTSLPCDQWIPTLYNFLNTGLIEFRILPPEKKPLEFVTDGINLVNSLLKSMQNAETQMYYFGSGLFFLEYEFYRYKYYGYPMALTIFSLHLCNDKNTNKYEILPPQGENIMLKRIELVKRPLDTVCHIRPGEYMIIMPNSKISQAAFVTNRIWQTICATPILPGIDKKNLRAAFGISNLPNDGFNLEDLVNSAYNSMKLSSNSNFPIVMSPGRTKNE